MKLSKNLESIKKIFIDHFKKLHNTFHDTRELFFPNEPEKGIFPHFFFKKDSLVQVNWTENVIEIRFNKSVIKSQIINNTFWNESNVRNYFVEIANHEYGHTISLKSIFHWFPMDTRQILIDKNLEDISNEDIIKCYSESKTVYPEFVNLRNINLQFFEEIFLDFWANLIVRDKINDKPPEETLRDRLSGFYELNPNMINSSTNLELLLYTQHFFIYDRWEDLERIFTVSNLKQLLFLYKSINILFNKIIQFNINFDLMEEDLVKLAKTLETLKYEDIILNNRFTNQDKRKLKAFIGILKKKKNK